MTKQELIARLVEISDRKRYDVEADHADADALLLVFINDPDVSAAYNKIEKWYA